MRRSGRRKGYGSRAEPQGSDAPLLIDNTDYWIIVEARTGVNDADPSLRPARTALRQFERGVYDAYGA
jgi:hypothetical protein